MMHKNYLRNHKTVLFSTLLIQGKLYQHCAEVEAQSKDMFDTFLEQMKEENQMEWVCRMQNIEARAKDIVATELIYT